MLEQGRVPPLLFTILLSQWMTAGRGILHAEMPCSEEPAHGLQLWVNLRSSEKMVEPQYQELKSTEIPKPSQNGVTIAVISGEALGVKVSQGLCVFGQCRVYRGVRLPSFWVPLTDGLQEWQDKQKLRELRNSLDTHTEMWEMPRKVSSQETLVKNPSGDHTRHRGTHFAYRKPGCHF